MRNPLKVRHTEYCYGFFPGGDPRLFSPDSDSMPEELENHRQACAAWDRGECRSESDGQWVSENEAPEGVPTRIIHLQRCQFGLGSYEWTEDLWIWEYIRWIWWDSFKSRLWWRWHLDVRNWAKERGLFRWRAVRALFCEAE